MESIRRIKVRLEVDTNKRTEVIERELDSLAELDDLHEEMGSRFA